MEIFILIFIIICVANIASSLKSNNTKKYNNIEQDNYNNSNQYNNVGTNIPLNTWSLMDDTNNYIETECGCEEFNFDSSIDLCNDFSCDTSMDCGCDCGSSFD